MKRHPRPAAKALKRPDWGVAQALVALGYLAASAVLGLVLAFRPATEVTLRLALVYGTFGLVGFLAQIVVGVSARLLPIFSWLRASADGPPPLTPHDLPDRRLQALTFFLWIAGVPALAAGFYFDRPALVSVAAWLLLAAVAAGGIASARIVRRGAGRGVAPLRP